MTTWTKRDWLRHVAVSLLIAALAWFVGAAIWDAEGAYVVALIFGLGWFFRGLP